MLLSTSELSTPPGLTTLSTCTRKSWVINLMRVGFTRRIYMTNLTSRIRWEGCKCRRGNSSIQVGACEALKWRYSSSAILWCCALKSPQNMQRPEKGVSEYHRRSRASSVLWSAKGSDPILPQSLLRAYAAMTFHKKHMGQLLWAALFMSWRIRWTVSRWGPNWILVLHPSWGMTPTSRGSMIS